MGKPWEKYAPAAAAPAPGPWSKYGGYTQETPPVRSLDPVAAAARTMQKPIMDAMGSAVLGRPLPTQPPPPVDPLAPKGGWSPGQQQQQQARVADPGNPFNPRNAGRPETGPPQQDFGAILEKGAKSIGGMIGGQRPESEALAQFGGSVVTDPVGAANTAIEAVDPIHQFAYAYNDADAALKAGVSGDWNQVGKELQDLVVSGSFAAMSVLPGAELAGAPGRIAGAVGSSASKTASTIAGQVFKPGPTAADRAADILIKKMQADGLTWEDIAKTARSLSGRGDSGVYETLSEVAALSGKSSGANMRGLAMALGSVPGPAQEAILARVAENAEKLAARTSRAASRATGQKAENAAATLDELETRLKTESGPLYDAAYSAPVDPTTFANEILPTLNTPPGKEAASKALSGMKTQEALLQTKVASRNSADQERAVMELERLRTSIRNLEGFIADPLRGPTPDTQALDHIKRAFDDQIDDIRGKYSKGNLRDAKSNFAESVSRATGGAYGQALGFYEDGKRLEEAFDIGLNAMKQPTWQLARDMRKGNRGAPFSGGEVEAIAMGVARHIEDLIEANDQAALTKLMKGKALKNLSTALGDPKAAAKFEESIQRLGANREWGRRVSGGSDTAMRQAAIDDASRLEEDPITRALDRAANSSAPPSIFGAAWQAVAKPAATAATDAYRRLKYPGIRDEEVNAALAPLMSQPLTAKPLEELGTLIEQRAASKGAPRLNAPKGPPPTKGAGGAANAAGRTAAGAGAVTVSTINQANADTRDKMEQTREKMVQTRADLEAEKASLAKLQADKEFFRTASPKELQERLIRDIGSVGPRGADGNIGKDTQAAITERQKQIDAEIEAARERITGVEKSIDDLEREDAYLSTRQDDWVETAKEIGPNLAFVLGLGLGEGTRLLANKNVAKKVDEEIARLNSKLNSKPVATPTGPKQERDLHNRYARINEIWREGGAAADEVPFKTTNAGEWRGQKAPPASSLFQPKAPNVRGADVKWMAAGGLDAGAMTVVAIPAAEKELEEATKAVEDKPNKENYTRLENAKNMLAIYQGAQRAGIGLVAGRGIGATAHKYKNVRPDMDAADAERVDLLGQIKKQKANGPPRLPGGGGPPALPPPPRQLPAPPAATAAPPPPANPGPIVKNGFGGSKPLAMDEASRMGRAREQGFNTDYKLFHATHSDFDAFDTKKIRTDLQIGEDAIFLTNSPAVADSYLGGAFVQRDAPKIIEKNAQGVDMGGGVGRYYSKDAAVYPVYARNLQDYEIWDMGGGGYDPEFMQRVIKEAKSNGAPGVILRGVRDPGIMDNVGPQGNPRTPAAVVVVFDPKDIRSVNATFDPAQSGSSKLLAGVSGLGGVGLISAAATMPKDEKKKPPR